MSTKTNRLRSALLSSVVAIVLCFSMLLGTTYAWFTDSVTSSGNIIKSGTLDVEMYWAKGTEDPASATWNDASEGAIFNYDKWEPGYTEVRHVKIVNAGTLAFKYQINIDANGEVTKLADVIDVYYVDPATQVTDRDALADNNKLGTLTDVLDNVSNTASGNLAAGESHTVTIALKMQESAGNEYQDLSIGSDFSVQLLATQLTAEEDSFDDQYDALATVDSEAELLAALDADYPLIIVGSNFSLTDTVVIPEGKEVTIDLAGRVISQVQEFSNSYSMFTVEKDAVLEIADSIGGGKLSLTNTHSVGGGSSWAVYTITNRGGELFVQGGTVENLSQQTGNANNAIFSYAGNTYINGGYISAPYSRSLRQWAGEVYINNGTFDGQVWIQATNDDCVFYVGGGSFKPATYGNDGSSIFLTNDIHVIKFEMEGGYIATKIGAYNTAADGVAGSVSGGTFTSFDILKSDYLADNANITVKLAKDLNLGTVNTPITIPEGMKVTLDLNGHTLSASANNTGNQEIFLVKGEMTAINGSIDFVAENNQGWNAMATIFDVTAGGKLTLENVKASVSGTDMNFIVHLNNWGTATADINNCDFDISYCAVRAFNSGNDMNTVTIKNTDVTGGGRLFWVHNYTSEGKDASTLTLDIYNNNNTCDNAKPVRFGFSNSVYYDLAGNVIS